MTETMNEAYTAGEKDYTALVSKMKDAGIDVVYVGGYHTEGGLILRQMREQGWTLRWCRATPSTPRSSGPSPAPPVKA